MRNHSDVFNGTDTQVNKRGRPYISQATLLTYKQVRNVSTKTAKLEAQHTIWTLKKIPQGLRVICQPYTGGDCQTANIIFSHHLHKMQSTICRLKKKPKKTHTKTGNKGVVHSTTQNQTAMQRTTRRTPPIYQNKFRPTHR